MCMCDCKKFLQTIKKELIAEMEYLEEKISFDEMLTDTEKKILIEKKDTLAIIMVSISKALKQ